MNELFLKIGHDKHPIEQDEIIKHHLTKGTISPFTNGIIVDAKGSSAIKQSKSKLKNHPSDDTSIIFTTAEILDIASGADSQPSE